jgi:hypothetical protein
MRISDLLLAQTCVALTLTLHTPWVINIDGYPAWLECLCVLVVFVMIGVECLLYLVLLACFVRGIENAIGSSDALHCDWFRDDYGPAVKPDDCT